MFRGCDHRTLKTSWLKGETKISINISASIEV